MTVIHHQDARRTETPNAVMTTFASPTQGGSDQALWQVEMAADARGPVHDMDAEQVWTVVEGSGRVVVGDEEWALGVGDTAVLDAGTTRQIVAGPTGLVAIVAGRGGAIASGPGRDPVVPPWIS
ncbi:cupin domain-containing protein [Actinomycetospora atypica]|uniref:Cupin domain-containing protein n=1 Tax=Actinomycetospora atypica TaxID=1290095 RepID=A0ABV9YRF8_9PSEU